MLVLGEFIAKYWLEVFFGLICAAVAAVAKHYVSLIKKEKQAQQDEIIKAMNAGLEAQKAQMQQDMAACSAGLMKIVEDQNKELLEADRQLHSEIDSLRNGILSIQGRAFKNECHRLLKDNHVIDVKEYESLLAEHIVYNNLGGNHEGDALFSMVEVKYRNTIGLKGE